MGRREELLRATGQAALIRDHNPTGNRTSFDIGGVVARMGVPVIYRPLNKLWGACVSVDEEHRGILVTNKLGRHVQRFTLAHEFGHYLLGHQMSLDETVGFAGRFDEDGKPDEEYAADTFASELLAPKRLIRASAKRHRWTRALLTQPPTVYQLSVRLGISFPAAAWALAAHDLITKQAAQDLQGQKVLKLKHALVGKSLLEDSWADVWHITSADTGTFLEAGPNDVFAIHLQENASAGFLWQLVEAHHVQVLKDGRPQQTLLYGAPTDRVVCVKFTQPGVHELKFAHVRPWNNETLESIHIAVDGLGKEQGGWSRPEKALALAAA